MTATRIWWMGGEVVLCSVMLAACTTKVVSPRQPSSDALACSAGQMPVAQRYWQGQYEWACGPAPCSGDKETVWRPVPGSWDARGGSRVVASCVSHCDSGEPRKPEGDCPGVYQLKSRVEQNELIVTAVIWTPRQQRDVPIPGVSISVGAKRASTVSATTDVSGQARFDLASGPLRQLVEADRMRAAPTDVLTVSGEFKDGTRARDNANIFGSAVSKSLQQDELRRAAEEQAAARTKLKDDCDRGDGDSCYLFGNDLLGEDAASALVYLRRACALKVAGACDAAGALEHPTAARSSRSAGSALRRCLGDCQSSSSSIVRTCLGLGGGREPCQQQCEQTCRDQCHQGIMDGPCDDQSAAAQPAAQPKADDDMRRNVARNECTERCWSRAVLGACNDSCGTNDLSCRNRCSETAQQCQQDCKSR